MYLKIHFGTTLSFQKVHFPDNSEWLTIRRINSDPFGIDTTHLICSVSRQVIRCTLQYRIDLHFIRFLILLEMLVGIFFRAVLLTKCIFLLIILRQNRMYKSSCGYEKMHVWMRLMFLFCDKIVKCILLDKMCRLTFPSDNDTISQATCTGEFSTKFHRDFSPFCCSWNLWNRHPQDKPNHSVLSSPHSVILQLVRNSNFRRNLTCLVATGLAFPTSLSSSSSTTSQFHSDAISKLFILREFFTLIYIIEAFGFRHFPFD